MQEHEQQACKQGYQADSWTKGTSRGFAEQVLTLCVGGTTYSTTPGTLTAVPGSYLAILFGNSPWQPSSLLPGSQTPFIDRDGELFRFVLAYLRFLRNCSCDSQQQQLMLPDSSTQLQQLKAEADFYGLPGTSETVFLYSQSCFSPPSSKQLPYQNQQHCYACMYEVLYG